MAKHAALYHNRPIMAEALETRALFTAILPFSDPTAPVLMNHLVSTGKDVKTTESLPDGTLFTVEVKRGVVDVYHVDNRLQLAVTSSDSRTSVILLGNPELATVTVAGPIKLFEATSNNDAGSVSINGSVKKLILGSVGGSVSVNGNVDAAQLGGVTGTFAVSGTINKLTIGSLSNATVLSGTQLGANNVLGGGDDVYGAGEIVSMKILGPVINSTVAVGTGPGVDATFGTADDANAGGGGFTRS